MSIKKMSALALTFAAVGAAGAAPAQAAVQGEFDAGSLTPGHCDVTIWWNTAGNPMTGATVPNPTYCIKPVTQLLGPITITIDDPDLPPINAD